MIFIHLFSKFARIIPLLLIGGILLTACGTSHNALKQPPTSTPKQATRETVSPFHQEMKTSDGKLLVQFTITPNRFGENMFVVDAKNVLSGKPETDEEVQLFTTMLDMQMATGVVMLTSNGSGHYSAQGSLSMDGNWDIHIQLLDNNAVHVAKLKVYVPG